MPGGASYFQMHEQDVRRSSTPLLHGWIRRTAARLFAASPPVGHLSPRVWSLRPRSQRHQPRDGGPQDDRAVGGDLRPARSRPDRSGYEGGHHCFRSPTIIDRATYDAPARMAEGIVHVFVNGTLAWTQHAETRRAAGACVGVLPWPLHPGTRPEDLDINATAASEASQALLGMGIFGVTPRHQPHRNGWARWCARPARPPPRQPVPQSLRRARR